MLTWSKISLDPYFRIIHPQLNMIERYDTSSSGTIDNNLTMLDELDRGNFTPSQSTVNERCCTPHCHSKSNIPI